jgi:hypothetical protein
MRATPRAQPPRRSLSGLKNGNLVSPPHQARRLTGERAKQPESPTSKSSDAGIARFDCPAAICRASNASAIIHYDKTFELKDIFPCNRYEEEHARSNLVGIHRNDFFFKGGPI